MRKVDFFIQQMARYDATSVELISGGAARFVFKTGHKDSNKVINHPQLLAMVKEIATSQFAADLKANGHAELSYRSEAGDTASIRVTMESPARWRMVLSKITETKARNDAPEVTPHVEPEKRNSASHGTAASLAPAMSEAPLGAHEPPINRYLRKMIKLGASDLHLSSDVAPMVRLHGEMKRLEAGESLGPEALRALVQQIMPERNIQEFDEIHDTDFAYSIEDVARFRVNVFLDRKGIGTVIRQIPFEILTPEQLGLPKQVLDLCWLSKGLVVVTGPTGSGKSTTLATLVDFINQNRSDHIITIEDPIEFVHANKKCLVNQREISTHTKSFKRALRAALREDPDIVLVGEMRDLETISIAIETAETGHLVFGTLHTTTAPSTVDRIIDQFPPEQQSQIRVMLSESLKGVIAQVLCRKKTKGRVAAYEILIATAAIGNLIREGKTFQIPSAMQTGRNLGMRLMNDHLLELVVTGQVDAQEAYIKSADKHSFKTLLTQNNIALTT